MSGSAIPIKTIMLELKETSVESKLFLRSLDFCATLCQDKPPERFNDSKKQNKRRVKVAKKIPKQVPKVHLNPMEE